MSGVGERFDLFAHDTWAEQHADASRLETPACRLYEFSYLRVLAGEWLALTEFQGLVPDQFVSTLDGARSVYLQGTTNDGRRLLGLPCTNAARGEPVFVLGCSHNFAHWLFDVLPRLEVWRSTPALQALPLLVDGDLKPFHRAYLELLGVDLKRCLAVPYPGSLVCRKAFFPSLRRERNFGRPVRTAAQLEFLRREIGLVANGGPKKIYVSRRAQPWERQRLANEAELLPLAEQAGFTVVDLEAFSVPEQIQLFRGAEAVVSVHGAGLTNTVFSPPGMRLVELVSEDFNRTYDADRWFAQSTRLLGQAYRRVVGPTTSEEALVVNRKARIDPVAFADALAWAAG